jgi:serine O-acetyltransferase
MEEILADCAGNLRLGEAGYRHLPTALLRSRGFRIALYYRLGHSLRTRKCRWLAGFFDRVLYSAGVDIHTGAVIGPGLRLPHPFAIVIGSKVRMGARVRVLQGATLGGVGHKDEATGQTQPIVGDDVVIGAGAKVLGTVTVGNRVRIGANAVVTRDLPDDCIAAGVPARVTQLNGQPVPLLEQSGELARVLREMSDRLARLEQKTERLSG